MQESDLKYDQLVKLVAPYNIEGRTESAAFLRWFLENKVRLEETDADDAICDASNDRGIDGIVVNDLNEQVLIFQSKITQNDDRTLGDKGAEYKATP
jgi:hypothetical protein